MRNSKICESGWCGHLVFCFCPLAEARFVSNFAVWNTYPTWAGKSRLVPLLASMGIMKTL